MSVGVLRSWAPWQWACGLLLIVGLAGCGWLDSEPDPGLYRATIDTPAGELPFALELQAAGADSALDLFLLDGAARLPAERIVRVADAFEVQLRGNGSTLSFTARGAQLNGALLLARPPDDPQSFSFRADNGLVFRFFAESATDNADVAGRWSTSIVGGGATLWRVADLQQSHDQLAGTLYGEAGRQQAVTGQVQGDEVRLSAFDGSTALLVTATVKANGELDGEYWSSQTGTADFRATRNPDAEVGL